MKHSQPPRTWSLRSVTHDDGRRLITLSRGLEQEKPKPSAAKAFAPSKAQTVARLAVRFASPAASAFNPAIRAMPVASRRSHPAKSTIPKLIASV